LVKSLGLTKAYDTSQASRRLQLFLLVVLDIFIIDNNTGGDRQGQGTWRVDRQRPPDRSDFIAYNRIGVMESTLIHGTEYVPVMDTGSESQQDEVWEQRWTYVFDEVYEVSWQEVWSQQTMSGILGTIHDIPMVGQLGHFRTRQ
jgi:hypothetical protein